MPIAEILFKNNFFNINRIDNLLDSWSDQIENSVEMAHKKYQNKEINISVAKKGSKLKVVNQAIKNAKDSLNRKLYESQNNKDLFEKVAKKFSAHFSIKNKENAYYLLHFCVFSEKIFPFYRNPILSRKSCSLKNAQNPILSKSHFIGNIL